MDEVALRAAGLVKGRWDGVKLLSTGGLKAKLVVRVHRVSAKAREAVEKLGGSVDLVPLMTHAAEAASKAHAGKGPSKA